MGSSPLRGPKVTGNGAHLLGVVSRSGVHILSEGVEPKFVIGEGTTEIFQVIGCELLVSNMVDQGVVVYVRGPLLGGSTIRDEILQLVDVDNTIHKEMQKGRVARNAFGRESEIVLGGGTKGPDGQDQRIGVIVIGGLLC
jgi:hypothetical protein